MNFRLISTTLSPQILKKVISAFPKEDSPVIINPQMEDTPFSGIIMAILQGNNLNPVLDAINATRNEYDALFYFISDAIDSREDIPVGSAQRMVKLAKALGKVMELVPNQMWVLEHSCVLRDIGKLNIPNDILLKKTVLTYDEWVMLKSHAYIGANILKERNIFPEIAEVIASHHECYDGDGYPMGIEGEEIPLLSRILKVIDVYCAMTSPRAYRSGMATREESVNYLQEERGKHFDPKVIDAFMQLDLREVDKE